MPTPEELAMYQQYAGNDFQNQDWASILKAIQGFNPDAYDGGTSYGMGSYTGPAIPGSGGWTMDEYQPGGGVTQLTRQATNQTGMDGANRRFDTVTIGADGKPIQQWQQTNDISDNGGLFSNIVPILGAVLAGGGLSGAFGPGAGAGAETVGGVSGGLDGVAGDSATSWLGADAAGASGETMAGFDALGNPLGGVPMTGPGGIGSVSSVAEGLGPAAYSDLGYTGLSGLEGAQGVNEWNKLVQQNAAEPGTALHTGVDAGSGILDKIVGAVTKDPRLALTAAGALSSLFGSKGNTSSANSAGGASGGSAGLDWTPQQKQWADSYFNTPAARTVNPYHGDLARAPIDGGEHMWFTPPNQASQTSAPIAPNEDRKGRHMAHGGYVDAHGGQEKPTMGPLEAYIQSVKSGQPIDTASFMRGGGNQDDRLQNAFDAANRFYQRFTQPNLNDQQMTHMSQLGLSPSQLTAPDYRQFGLDAAPNKDGMYGHVSAPNNLGGGALDALGGGRHVPQISPQPIPPVVAPHPMILPPMTSPQVGQPQPPSQLQASQPSMPQGPQTPSPMPITQVSPFGWSNPAGWPMANGGYVHGGMMGSHDGQEDNVPIMGSHGEFMIPADIVSALGSGSSDGGAEALHGMIRSIREHYRGAGSDNIPPKAKSPLAYLRDGMGK